jgi:hypothetical protein
VGREFEVQEAGLEKHPHPQIFPPEFGKVRPKKTYDPLRRVFAFGGPLDIKAARSRFHSQRTGAKKRGIGWEFTFQQWLDWWGEDLDRRGVGLNCLQMQRLADTGPYRPDNVRKGTPKQNGRTRSAMYRKREGERIAAERFAAEMEAPCVKHEPMTAADRALLQIQANAPKPGWQL